MTTNVSTLERTSFSGKTGRRFNRNKDGSLFNRHPALQKKSVDKQVQKIKYRVDRELMKSMLDSGLSEEEHLRSLNTENSKYFLDILMRVQSPEPEGKKMREKINSIINS